MFLTRSIRRKMISVLGAVCVMLAVLASSGAWGLLSFRALVNDPAVNQQETSTHAHVITAIARLRDTLPRASENEVRGFDVEEFEARRQEARVVNSSYRRLLKSLHGFAQPQNHPHPAEQLSGNIELMLRSLSANDMRQLDHQMQQLQQLAVALPELPDELRQRVREARDTYRSSIAFLTASSVLVVVLLAWLVRFGFKHVFQPIHELHQGARRVAQGDFDYRVHQSSDDEVGELAEAFNLMAERFQEIAADLDGQVKARSQQLVRSERLASVGFLAAGVAHEINNPLTAIRWTGESLESRLSELLKDAPRDDASIVQTYVRMIQSESERCQEITRKLLDFSRNHETERSLNDVSSIIREVLTLIVHMKKYRSGRLSFDHPEPCLVEINPHEIKQVVLNLVANGLDATEGTGSLHVDIVENVDTVELRFTDNGCGLTSEVMDNLFEPFFTTKPTGQGTGLGLSISHRIVTDHGGRIEVHSNGPGTGSTFVVRLPRQQRGAKAQQTATPVLSRSRS